MELPLSWHDFCIDAADVDAGVEAGLVVRVDDVAPVRFLRTRGAVVRSLSHTFCSVSVTISPAFLNCYQLVLS